MTAEARTFAPSSSAGEDLPTTRRAEYTSAALDLLDQHGPAQQTLGITVAAVCEAAGLHRSTVYRHFETVQDLNDAIASWLTTEVGSWRAALVDQDPTIALRTALARALPHPGEQPGAWMRGAVTSWDAEHPARRAFVAHERHHQERLAAWLGEHLQRTGLRPVAGVTVESLALGVAALVEGDGMLHWIDAAPATGWDERARRTLVERAVGFVHDLVEPGRAASA